MADNVIEGLILSVIADYGPDPIINLSALDQLIAQKLSIIGLTILSMGFLTADISRTRDYNLLGPIPVPDSSGFAAVCVFFNVIPDLGTKDNRVEKFGRECNLWLIFEVPNRDRIFKQFSRIENLVNTHLVQFKNVVKSFCILLYHLHLPKKNMQKHVLIFLQIRTVIP